MSGPLPSLSLDMIPVHCSRHFEAISRSLGMKCKEHYHRTQVKVSRMSYGVRLNAKTGHTTTYFRELEIEIWVQTQCQVEYYLWHDLVRTLLSYRAYKIMSSSAVYFPLSTRIVRTIAIRSEHNWYQTLLPIVSRQGLSVTCTLIIK